MVARVLLADSLAREPFEPLINAGIEVVVRPDLTAESLPAAVPGFKVLVVRSTKVTAATIEAGRDLALIVRAGSGTNNIDVSAASGRGIFVSNCPGKNSAAVAELALGLMLAIDRRIPDNVIDLKASRWNKKGYSQARGLKGRVLGMVGYGAIAKEVAQRARGFEMELLAYSRSLTEAECKDEGIRRAISLEQLFGESDVVSLHLPLTADTRGIIDRRLLGLLRPGSALINTARAELVDEAALIEALAAGRFRYGTDVFGREPEKGGSIDDALAGMEGVYGTHHIGASTEQAQEAIARETVRIVRKFCETGEVVSPVNLLLAPPSMGTLVVRHLDRVGVLASVLGALSAAQINVETMENVVFTGGAAACARIRVSTWPGEALIADLRRLENVLHVEMV
jgi:D-3-phosphoglycerate dehydrogenase